MALFQKLIILLFFSLAIIANADTMVMKPAESSGQPCKMKCQQLTEYTQCKQNSDCTKSLVTLENCLRHPPQCSAGKYEVCALECFKDPAIDSLPNLSAYAKCASSSCIPADISLNTVKKQESEKDIINTCLNQCSISVTLPQQTLCLLDSACKSALDAYKQCLKSAGCSEDFSGSLEIGQAKKCVSSCASPFPGLSGSSKSGSGKQPTEADAAALKPGTVIISVGDPLFNLYPLENCHMSCVEGLGESNNNNKDKKQESGQKSNGESVNPDINKLSTTSFNEVSSNASNVTNTSIPGDTSNTENAVNTNNNGNNNAPNTNNENSSNNNTAAPTSNLSTTTTTTATSTNLTNQTNATLSCVVSCATKPSALQCLAKAQCFSYLNTFRNCFMQNGCVEATVGSNATSSSSQLCFNGCRNQTQENQDPAFKSFVECTNSCLVTGTNFSHKLVVNALFLCLIVIAAIFY